MHSYGRGHKPQKIYKRKELPPVPPSPNRGVRFEPSDNDWLILLASGLDEMHMVWAPKEGSQKHTVFMVLESIDLLQFLTNVWRWQDVDICQSFVLHWDHKSKTSKVLGINIDAGFRNFLLLTGLDGLHNEHAAGSSGQAMQGNHDNNNGKKWVHAVQGHHDIKGKKKRGMDYVEDLETKSISFLLLNNPIIEALLLLLSKTLWFTAKHSHCPTKDMVYLLVEAMRGKKMDWSRCIYEKFISEIRELQDRHENYPEEKLQTLAGPLMCFLYAKAKYRAEASKENVRGVGHGNRGRRDDRSFLGPYKGYGRGVLKEKNLLDTHHYDYDDDEVVPPGFSSGNLKLPFPPSIMPRKRWYESSEQSSAVMNLIPQPELPCKTHKEIQSELEEKFSKMIMSEGYPQYRVSEETMTTLVKTSEEQKARQERFKHHLRTCWQRSSGGCSFGCCKNGK